MGADVAVQGTRAPDDVRGHGSARAAAPVGRDPVRRWGLLVPVVAAVVGGAAAASGDQSLIGSWGLIQALPWPYFVALAVVGASFVLQLYGLRDEEPTLLGHLTLGAHVVCLVFLLHGAPALLESEPRFATAWLHAGFTDQILERGVTRTEVDARFSWPGFFAAAAAVAGAAGIEDPMAFVRWAPTVAVLLYLPPLYVIARHLTRSTHAAWLAIFLVVPVNWVGQDYFAPQTMGFVLYLWWLTLLVLFFRQGPQLRLPRFANRWRRLPHDGDPDLTVSPKLRAGALMVVVLLTAAAAVSHQLTPIMMVFTASALMVAGRLRFVTFPVIALLLTAGWLSLGATAYWTGHLDAIFGNAGNLQASLGGVKGRVEGSPEHLTVVRIRLVFSAVTWLSAAAATWFLWARRGRAQVTLAVLVVAPIAGMAQPYGGEAVLRVFLFSSPFACMVLAQTALAMPWRRAAHTLVAVTAVALLPLFVLIRYGNESYEQVRPDEVRAMEVVYDIAPFDSNLISPTSQVPWRFINAADYRYRRPADALGFRDGLPTAIRNPVSEGGLDAPATYLIVTDGQIVYATEALGSPEGWFEDLVKPQLTPENGYQLVYENDAALVYEFTGAEE